MNKPLLLILLVLGLLGTARAQVVTNQTITLIVGAADAASASNTVGYQIWRCTVPDTNRTTMANLLLPYLVVQTSYTLLGSMACTGDVTWADFQNPSVPTAFVAIGTNALGVSEASWPVGWMPGTNVVVFVGIGKPRLTVRSK